MNEECALQQPDRVRSRVRGSHGPDRRDLPLFQKLGALDADSLSSLQTLVHGFVGAFPEGYNDIENGERYAIANACTLKSYFPPEYKQYLLQLDGNQTSDVPDEWEYDTYTPEAKVFEPFISAYLDPHFRARISVLPPGAELDWHIDSNTSYACRAQMMVSGSHRFQIKKKGRVHEQVMVPGDVWFCNTGYSHRVEVLGEETRVAILIGFHYEAIGGGA